MIVADTNLIAYLLLQGEHTEAAEQVLKKDSHWIAPLLWRSEFRNVLVMFLRQRKITQVKALERMGLAEQLLEGREYAVPSEDILALTEGTDCSAYDCEFVALAKQQSVPLVTSDRRILRAFSGVAVSPVLFAENG